MRHDNGVESLDARVTIHDRSQFEVQFAYGIAPEHLTMSKDTEHYRLEAYYFFPSNLGVTALNFPREAFYRNLSAYIRFRTPEMSEMALLDPLNRRSPLNVLSFMLKQLSMGQSLDEELASGEARLFATIASDLMRTQLTEIQGLLGRCKSRTEPGMWRQLEGRIGDTLNTLPEIVVKYRELMGEFRLAQEVSPELLDRLEQVDEFLTYRLDHTLSALHFDLAATWASPIRMELAREQVHHLAQRESEYRAKRGYISLSPGDDQALALYTYRSGALKKLMDQALYLDIKTVQTSSRWRNLTAGLGAMAAALFAGLSDRTVTLPLYQHSLWLAVTVFALFYVLKDRMKEVLREYVWGHVARYFPDNRLTIMDPLKQIDVGHCLERVGYLNKKQVPADILKVRNASHAIDLDQERKETVIGYRNDLNLYAREILHEHQRRTHIKHILRFSVEDLLARLDNPTARIQFYDPDSKVFCRLRAPKVYHLNVVFKLVHWDDRGREEVPQYCRIRVILDKNGIHRIDTVTPLGRLGLLGAYRPPEMPVEVLPQRVEEDVF